MLNSEAIGRVIAKGSQNASSLERSRKAGKDGTGDVWKRNGQPPATPVEAQIASVRDAIGKVGEAEGALKTAGAAMGALTAIEQAISAPLSAIPFPGFPAVRVTDKALGLPHAHMHPPNLIPPAPPVPLPSMGPVIKIPFLSGADTVLINGLPAARCGDLGLGIWCGGYFPLYEIFLGSSSVWIEGARAARLGVDITKHCVFTTPRPSDPPLGPMIGTTITGSPNVIIGGIPMPSLSAMAIGSAFKLVFKGLGKVGQAIRSHSPFSRKLALIGRAQSPKLKWNKNPGGEVRSIQEAVDIARRNGVHIPEDIRFARVRQKDLPKDAFAEYAQLGRRGSDDLVEWPEFYNRFDQIPVRVSDEILDSDEAIVAVLGHEMHELNGLRKLFDENGGQMPASQLHRAIAPGFKGNLHDEAWDVADDLVNKMRAEGGGTQ
jgi:uncharacterized Zn-binding protein involved in type VI secretion